MTTPWTRDLFGTEEEENAGAAGVYFSQFANAVSLWTCLQRRTVSIAEAALAFNVAPALVEEAIEWHPWMYTDGATIMHDGE